MRAWQIDTKHGLFAVDVSSTTWKGRKMAVVSLRRPDVAGGTKQSLVPKDRAFGRVRRLVAAVVSRLEATGLAG